MLQDIDIGENIEIQVIVFDRIKNVDIKFKMAQILAPFEVEDL